MAALVPLPVVPQITPQDKYVVHSTLLNICDMKKDQEPSYSSDVARSITNNSWATEAAALATGWNPPAVGGAGVAARNFYTSPPSKEDMVKMILNNHIFNGAPDPAPNNLYTTLQNTIPGTTGSVQVAWSDQTYTYKCFDIDIEGDGKLETFMESTIGEIQTFLAATKPILRITDTTRNGSLILAAIPNDILIHGHTPPVEFDACSKLTYLSGSGLGAEYPLLNNAKKQKLRSTYMKRYFWELPPEAGISIKIKYNKIDDGDTAATVANTPSKHMLIKREINLEYKGLKDDKKKTLNVEMTYINQAGKPVRIDEKTNTAGALKKMDVIQHLKKAFGIESGKNAAEMVHISKLNGDVGQVLETWRQILLTNGVVNAAGVPNTVNSKDCHMAFESYDCNAVMKAFLEGVDFIFFHTWPTAEAMDKAKNLIIFKKNEFNDPKTIYNALYKEYSDLYKTVSEEIGIYNEKKDKVNQQIEAFTEIISNFNPYASNNNIELDDNEAYVNAIKFFVQAAVLQTYIPSGKITEKIPQEYTLPIKDLIPQIENKWFDENKVFINNPESEIAKELKKVYDKLKQAISIINSIRSSLKIPATYANLEIVVDGALVPVDIEKQIFFEKEDGKAKANTKSIYQEININEILRTPRNKGVFSTSSSKLGIQCIQFILNKKNEYVNEEFIKTIRAICKKEDPSAASTNYDTIIKLLSLDALDQKIGAMEGGRNLPQGSVLLNTGVYPMMGQRDIYNTSIRQKENRTKRIFINTRKKLSNNIILKKTKETFENELQTIQEYLLTSNIFVYEIEKALLVSNKIAEARSNEEIRGIIEEYISQRNEDFSDQLSGGGGRKAKKLEKRAPHKQSVKAKNKAKNKANQYATQKLIKDQLNRERKMILNQKRREAFALAQEKEKKRLENEAKILEKELEDAGIEANDQVNNGNNANENMVENANENMVENANENMVENANEGEAPNEYRLDDLNINSFSSSFCLLEYDLELLANIKERYSKIKERLDKIMREYNDLPAYIKEQSTLDFINYYIQLTETKMKKIDALLISEDTVCDIFSEKEKLYHKQPPQAAVGGSLKRAKRYRKTRKIRRSKE